MINSIWRNQAICRVAQILFGGLCFLYYTYVRDVGTLIVTQILWISLIVIGVVVFIVVIKRIHYTQSINNFIYGNPGYIKVKTEECKIDKTVLANVNAVQYVISKEALIGDRSCLMFHVFQVNWSKQWEFERCLKNQGEIEFVYNRESPSYNMMLKTDEIKKLDNAESYVGWRNDYRALVVVVLDIILMIAGSISIMS